MRAPAQQPQRPARLRRGCLPSRSWARARAGAAAGDPRHPANARALWGGRGRTGELAALARIVYDGWDVERAIDEAKELTMWRPLQQHFVREFARKWQAGEITI